MHYNYLIVSSHLCPCVDKTLSRLWDLSFPLKIKCFVWLDLKNHVLTWDNLISKGWKGPSHCGLCLSGEESVHHLFVDCSITRSLFIALSCSLNFSWPVSDVSPGSLLEN